MMIKYITIAILFVACALNLSNAKFHLDFCPTCVDFINNDMGDLEKICSGAVASSCGAVCSLLPSSAEQTVCNLLCDIVGIDEFIKVFNDVDNDVDPVFICEKLTVCPVNKNANGSVVAANISPSSGPHGTTFTIGAAYEITSLLGTGEIAVMVTDPTGTNGFGDAQLLVNQKPGAYQASFSFQAKPSEQEEFPAGLYQVQLMLCQSGCGTKHGVTFNTFNSNFTVVSGGSISGSGSGTGSGGSSSGSGAAFF